MLELAINLLWLLIIAIILCAVIWLVIYGIRQFIYDIPARVEQAVWFIVLLLVLIAILTMLAGGGAGLRGPSFWRHGALTPSFTWADATAAFHLPKLLT